MKTPLPVQRLRELLEYDSESGLFRWIGPTVRQAKGWFKGNKSVRNYRRLYIEGHHYMAHVVAWALMNGEWPATDIDHINHNQSDNCLLNLRIATDSQNAKNRSINRNNKTGISGVTHFGNRFRATIACDYRKYHIGLFDTVDQAGAARQSAEQALFGEFAPCR